MDHNEQILKTINEIRRQLKAKKEYKNKSDDEIDRIILDGFLKAFDEGEMDKESFLGIMDLMGYEPTEEFLKAISEEE